MGCPHAMYKNTYGLLGPIHTERKGNENLSLMVAASRCDSYIGCSQNPYRSNVRSDLGRRITVRTNPYACPCRSDCVLLVVR